MGACALMLAGEQVGGCCRQDMYSALEGKANLQSFLSLTICQLFALMASPPPNTHMHSGTGPIPYDVQG